MSQAAISELVGAEDDDLLLISAGPGESPLHMLGNARLACGRLQEEVLDGDVVDTLRGGAQWRSTADMFWVVNFPAFEVIDGVSHDDDVPAVKASHHPFTLPVPEHVERLAGADYRDIDALLSIRSQHYDLVCNGVELGGGSVRCVGRVLSTCVCWSPHFAPGARVGRITGSIPRSCSATCWKT